MRTLGSIREQYQKFSASSTNKAADFDNCINSPLFSGPDATTIFEICPPDELHLLLGIVKTIVDALNEAWGNDRLNQWLEENGIKRESYYGGTMNGNACNRLLKKIRKLRPKLPKRLQKFVTTLEVFDKVKKGCFSSKGVSSTYRRDIEKFAKLYDSLAISYTPKVHILIGKEICVKSIS